MPDRPETWAWFATWLEHHWPAVYAGLLATAIAALRVMYGGGTLRRLAVEAPLCGCVALAVSHGLPLLGIPASTAPFFGGVIGLVGIEVLRAAARKKIVQEVEQL